ncbi:MAG: hypothetical protein L0Y68_05585, partial [Candidatus Dadabacteria bacterium]|nr:hypothetical protein [Candidatus Dadabacteria bacterium]
RPFDKVGWTVPSTGSGQGSAPTSQMGRCKTCPYITWVYGDLKDAATWRRLAMTILGNYTVNCNNR